MTRFLLFSLGFIIFLAPTHEIRADPVSVDRGTYTEIQIGQFQGLKEAIQMAKSAEKSLKYPLNEETVQNPKQAIRSVGAVIEIYQNKKDLFIVTAFLGDKNHGEKSLDYYYQNIRTFYPLAQKVVINKSSDEVDYQQQFVAYQVSNVIILGSYKEYDQALKSVNRLSQATKVPYDDGGNIYDTKKGLRTPEDAEHPSAGFYLARRYHDCDGTGSNCLSIEISDYYEGFSPGYYIIVGGIVPIDEKSQNLEALMQSYKKSVPDAYYKRTLIYMGCQS